MVSFASSVYQIGNALSALVIGFFSDRYGRSLCLKVSLIFEIISGFSLAFSYNIYQYLISRLFVGFFSYGRYLSGLLLGIQ